MVSRRDGKQKYCNKVMGRVKMQKAGSTWWPCTSKSRSMSRGALSGGCAWMVGFPCSAYPTLRKATDAEST